jgi:HK97 family phage major capsid protein
MSLTTLKKELKEATTVLGKAITDCRAIGDQMRENPEKKAELKDGFDRALEDVTTAKMETQSLQEQIDAEEHYLSLTEAPDATKRITNADDLSRTQKDTELRKAAHNEAFEVYMRSREDNSRGAAIKVLVDKYGMGPEEANALISTDDIQGGFTVPDDFRAEVLKATAGFSVVRQSGARVVPTGRSTVTFPTINPGTDPYSSDLATGTDTGTPNSNWKHEGHTVGGVAPPVQQRPTFGQETIPVHVWQPDVIEITMELLEDTAVPLDSILAELLGETKGLDEDREMLIGTGVGAPEGLTQAGSGTVDVSAGATTAAINYAGICNLYTGLPAQYRQNASWFFNSTSLGALMQMESTAGMPIWPPNAEPTTVIQRPYYVTEFLPDFADDTTVCMIFGDMRHYIIAERKAMVIQRLVERFAPNVGILATARVGGQVTVANAFRLGVGSA